MKDTILKIYDDHKSTPCDEVTDDVDDDIVMGDDYTVMEEDDDVVMEVIIIHFDTLIENI